MTTFTVPPGNKTAGETGFVTDINSAYGALAAVATGNVLDTAYGGGADPTGTNDSTAAIQAALNAGLCVLPQGGNFKVGNLTIPAGAVLDGNNATLTAAAGTTGFVLALAAPATTRFVNIRNLTINCGSITGLSGVSLNNTGLSPSTPGFHRLDNVTVSNAGQDGFYYAALQECFTLRCLSFGAGRYGFNVQNGATDSRWVSCTSGGSGSDGFYVSGSNCHYVACKAYYAGWTSGGGFTHGAGWHIDAISTYFTAGVSFTSCEAQDCADNGWFFDPSGGPINNLAMAACVIDSCNAAANTGALACGISTGSLVNSSIIGNTVFNRSGGAGTMAYYLAVAGVQTGLFISGSSANVTNTGIFYVSGYGYTLIESFLTDLSGVAELKAGSVVLAPAGSAALSTGSTITPGINQGAYPVTATANVTGIIMAPGTIAWQTVKVVNESAFSVTFAAAATSNVADGTADVIAAGTAASYIWSGTYWYRG